MGRHAARIRHARGGRGRRRSRRPAGGKARRGRTNSRGNRRRRAISKAVTTCKRHGPNYARQIEAANTGDQAKVRLDSRLLASYVIFDVDEAHAQLVERMNE